MKLFLKYEILLKLCPTQLTKISFMQITEPDPKFLIIQEF